MVEQSNTYTSLKQAKTEAEAVRAAQQILQSEAPENIRQKIKSFGEGIGELSLDHADVARWKSETNYDSKVEMLRDSWRAWEQGRTRADSPKDFESYVGMHPSEIGRGKAFPLGIAPTPVSATTKARLTEAQKRQFKTGVSIRTAFRDIARESDQRARDEAELARLAVEGTPRAKARVELEVIPGETKRAANVIKERKDFLSRLDGDAIVQQLSDKTVKRLPETVDIQKGDTVSDKVSKSFAQDLLVLFGSAVDKFRTKEKARETIRGIGPTLKDKTEAIYKDARANPDKYIIDALYMVMPGLYTGTHWKEMSQSEKHFSVAMDAALIGTIALSWAAMAPTGGALSRWGNAPKSVLKEVARDSAKLEQANLRGLRKYLTSGEIKEVKAITGSVRKSIAGGKPLDILEASENIRALKTGGKIGKEVVDDLAKKIRQSSINSLKAQDEVYTDWLRKNPKSKRRNVIEELQRLNKKQLKTLTQEKAKPVIQEYKVVEPGKYTPAKISPTTKIPAKAVTKTKPLIKVAPPVVRFNVSVKDQLVRKSVSDTNKKQSSAEKEYVRIVGRPLEGTELRVLGRGETAVEIGQDTQTRIIETAEEAIREAEKIAAREQTKVQTLEQLKTSIKQQVQEQVQQQLKVLERVMPQTQVKQLVRVTTSLATKTATKTDFKKVRIAEKGDQESSDKKKREKIKRATGFTVQNMGKLRGKDVWHVWLDSGEHMVVLGKRPKGAKDAEGKGSAYKTSQRLGSKVGFPEIEYKHGAIATIIKPSRVSKGAEASFLPVSIKKGRQYITRVGRHDLVSRRPLGRKQA